MCYDRITWADIQRMESAYDSVGPDWSPAAEYQYQAWCDHAATEEEYRKIETAGMLAADTAGEDGYVTLAMWQQALQEVGLVPERKER